MIWVHVQMSTLLLAYAVADPKHISTNEYERPDRAVANPYGGKLAHKEIARPLDERDNYPDRGQLDQDYKPKLSLRRLYNNRQEPDYNEHNYDRPPLPKVYPLPDIREDYPRDERRSSNQYSYPPPQEPPSYQPKPKPGYPDRQPQYHPYPIREGSYHNEEQSEDLKSNQGYPSKASGEGYPTPPGYQQKDYAGQSEPIGYDRSRGPPYRKSEDPYRPEHPIERSNDSPRHYDPSDRVPPVDYNQRPGPHGDSSLHSYPAYREKVNKDDEYKPEQKQSTYNPYKVVIDPRYAGVGAGPVHRDDGSIVQGDPERGPYSYFIPAEHIIQDALLSQKNQQQYPKGQRYAPKPEYGDRQPSARPSSSNGGKNVKLPFFNLGADSLLGPGSPLYIPNLQNLPEPTGYKHPAHPVHVSQEYPSAHRHGYSQEREPQPKYPVQHEHYEPPAPQRYQRPAYGEYQDRPLRNDRYHTSEEQLPYKDYLPRNPDYNSNDYDKQREHYEPNKQYSDDQYSKDHSDYPQDQHDYPKEQPGEFPPNHPASYERSTAKEYPEEGPGKHYDNQRSAADFKLDEKLQDIPVLPQKADINDIFEEDSKEDEYENETISEKTLESKEEDDDQLGDKVDPDKTTLPFHPEFGFPNYAAGTNFFFRVPKEKLAKYESKPNTV